LSFELIKFADEFISYKELLVFGCNILALKEGREGYRLSSIP